MSVGFGFSVGDFISAIELVGTVIDALRSSSNASLEYRELIRQLLSLETALIQVKRLEFEEGQYAEVNALREAAGLCRRTIDNFLKKIEKYQPSLNGASGDGRSIRDIWMKVKWARCKKEDVAGFKADLVGHTESIQLLLTTVQMNKASLQDKRNSERQISLAGKMQEGFFSLMQQLTAVKDQGKQSLERTAEVLRTNAQVFQMMLQLQNFITHIPAQVERQQPVYLIDALGRTTPFHLEFMTSAEALLSVLRINFKKHGNGAEKIDKGEFAIQDIATRRDIDLKADWEICFQPGQRVEMSMVFHRHNSDPERGRLESGTVLCWHCKTYLGEFHKNKMNYYDCNKCGKSFQRGTKQIEGPDKLSEDVQSIGRDATTTLPLSYLLAAFRKVRIYEFSTSHSSQTSVNPNEQSPELKERVVEEIKRRKRLTASWGRPSMAAWWKCCNCEREVNTMLYGGTCPGCYYDRCDYCTKY